MTLHLYRVHLPMKTHGELYRDHWMAAECWTWTTEACPSSKAEMSRGVFSECFEGKWIRKCEQSSPMRLRMSSCFAWGSIWSVVGDVIDQALLVSWDDLRLRFGSLRGRLELWRRNGGGWLEETLDGMRGGLICLHEDQSACILVTIYHQCVAWRGFG